MRADGTIDFLGRIDRQIKLRGFRIELGEIEAALRTCPGVADALAEVKGEGETRRIIGYLVGGTDHAAVGAALAGRLPGHMVPAALVTLDRLPTMPNGKIDRAALPEPDAANALYAPPRNQLEETLCKIWSELLQVPEVGIRDDFFALGGHSILLLKFVAMAKALSLPTFALEALFSHPTVEDLAAYLSSVPGARPSNFIPLNRVDHAPPLFCIHPGFGLVGHYRSLAQTLDGQLAVYGIQSPLFTRPGWNPQTMAELARDYVSDIRQVQPKGPYRILGWSFGGWVATEIAGILQAEGEAVSLLGLVDTLVHRAHGQVINLHPDGREEVANLFRNFTKGQARADQLGDDEAEILRQVLAVDRLHGHVTRDYATPQVASRITLWWARSARDYPEAESHWRQRAPGGIDIVGPFASGHMEIITDPEFIRDFAGRVQATPSAAIQAKV
jgi:thioesterase domain-containing protein